jgi:beta-glucosidase
MTIFQQGRTYKYYNATSVAAQTGAPGDNLYELGFGLSYSTFTLSGSCPVHPPWRVESAAAALAAPPLACSVTVTNTSPRDGDEVVTVFVVPAAAAVARGRAALSARAPRRDPLASRLLVAFARVAVPAGGQAVVPFNITLPSFAGVADDGARTLYAGAYDVVFSRGHGADVVVAVDVGAAGAAPLALRRDPTW